MVHDPVAPAAAPAAIRVDLRQRPTRVSGKVLAIIFAIIAAVVLIPTGIGLFVAYKAASSVSSAINTGLTSPTTPVKRVATLADLPTLGPGYQPLDVAPPAGGFAAFDAVAGLPWAVTIAQAWNRDARVTRIDLTRVRPDGTINLQDDREGQVRYRFASPSKIDELRRQADLSASAELATEFWVQVQAGQTTVMSVRNKAGMLPSSDGQLPEHPRSLTSTAIWKQLSSRPGYDAPFHSGYLIHLEREGWVWYFSSLSGKSQPRVRARDARIWPY